MIPTSRTLAWASFVFNKGEITDDVAFSYPDYHASRAHESSSIVAILARKRHFRDIVQASLSRSEGRQVMPHRQTLETHDGKFRTRLQLGQVR